MKGLSVPCQLPGFLHLLRRKTVRAAPYLASSSLAPRNHLFSISAGSPGIPSRKPGPRRLQSAQTASLAFSDLGLSSVGIPQWKRRQSKDSSMDKGALLVETKVAASPAPLAEDSPAPQPPPLVWVCSNDCNAEAPPDHSAPLVLDLGSMNPLTSAAASCKADSWLTQAGSGLHSLLSLGGGKEKNAESMPVPSTGRVVFHLLLRYQR